MCLCETHGDRETERSAFLCEAERGREGESVFVRLREEERGRVLVCVR